MFSISTVGPERMSVHAEFDNAGNYVCNPFKTEVETNIYISTVQKINNNLYLFTQSFPNSTLQQRHDVIVNDTKIWDLYNKSKQCLVSLGINPDKVTPLSESAKQAVAIPEFGSLSIAILLISLVSTIIFKKRFNSAHC